MGVLHAGSSCSQELVQGLEWLGHMELVQQVRVEADQLPLGFA